MLLHTIVETLYVVRIGGQLLVQCVGIEMGPCRAAGERRNHVVVPCAQRVFGIVFKGFKSVRILTVINGEEIVRIGTRESGARPVPVAGVVGDDHVVDDVVDIEKALEGWVRRAVGIQSLCLIVVRVRGKSHLPGIVKAVEGIAVPIGRPPIFSDDVVVLLVASEVGLRKGRLGPFLRLKQPPVDAVDVEMVESAAGGWMPHLALDVPGPNISEKIIPAVVLE